ncbi:MAG: type II toxin-antitoxin system RelE/ParE family toxin [Verrucomicrobiota bacterium]
MRFDFHPEALVEYQQAAQFYASRQDNLDLRFINSVEQAIRRLLNHPEQHRVIEADVRRCLTKVFPYAILFTVEQDYILIVAVMHCHREPGYWRERLNQKP